MESTFTKQPTPVADTETHWQDNVDHESEYARKWSGDAKLKLPPRTATARFAHVPDYNDADFDKTNSEAYIRARDQRYRERFVAIAEMKLLQDDLRTCFATHTVNAPRLCRPIAQEYLRRLKCPLYVCDQEKRPVLIFSPTAQYGVETSKHKPYYGGEHVPFESK